MKLRSNRNKFYFCAVMKFSKNIGLVLTLWAIFFATQVAAQKAEKDSVFWFTGKVLSDEYMAVPSAHIINTQNLQIAVSSNNGFFEMPVTLKDTLRISSIGFYTKYVAIKDVLDNSKVFSRIVLSRKTYQLGEVDVFSLTYEEFKQLVIEDKPTEEELKQKKWLETILSPQELADIKQPPVQTGITLNFRSPRQKQYEKLREIKKREAENEIIEAKFNKQMIKNITGLQGDRLLDFIWFCNFDRHYLLHAKEYDIIVGVQEYFKIYKKIFLSPKQKAKN